VRFVDELVALDHGVIVASGTPEQVTSNPEVIEAYLGKKWKPAPVPGAPATESV
jgi:branched-chain amino acid transport system permease protein